MQPCSPVLKARRFWRAPRALTIFGPARSRVRLVSADVASATRPRRRATQEHGETRQETRELGLEWLKRRKRLAKRSGGGARARPGPSKGGGSRGGWWARVSATAAPGRSSSKG